MENSFNETPENYSPKQLCCFVLDTSSSMEGLPIHELKEGLKIFLDEVIENSTLADRLELSIVGFNDSAILLRNPSLIIDNNIPEFQTSGISNLVCGIDAALKIVWERKEWYKQTGQAFYRPWVILITDALANENSYLDEIAKEIDTCMNEKKLMFFAIGVNGADMELLNKISSPRNPAVKLNGVKFSEFFQFLDNSSRVHIVNSSPSNIVNLPNPNDWDTFEIL